MFPHILYKLLLFQCSWKYTQYKVLVSNDHCTDIDRYLIFKILTNPARVKLIFPYIKSSNSGKLASGNSMVDKDDKVGNKTKYRKERKRK